MGLLERYYRINQATGICVHVGMDGRLTINLCTVSAAGNQLNIQHKATNLTDLAQIKQHIQPKSIIALNLCGKGIVHKQIDRVEIIDQKNLSAILPNINPEDFYVQNFVSGEKSFISITRKTDADRWLQALNELGLRPLMLSLGPFPLENILPQLNVYEQEFTVDGHVIARNDKGEWTGYRYNQALTAKFPLKLESEKIDERLAIPYAIAFQTVLAGKLDVVAANAGQLEAALQERFAQNKLKTHGAVILTAIFVLLLVNFVLFSWLNASNGALAEKASVNDQNTTALQKINEQVKKKEMQLEALGWDGGVDKSFLVDQIACLLPPEVNLTAIAINPIDQASTRTNKSLTFFKNKMLVSGVSGNILPVNEWMARIKTKHWAKNIQLESYSYDSELNTGKFIISIDF